MDLYGFSVNEHSPSMEKKIYYCKIMNDIRQMSKHIPIYQTYQKRGSLHAVVEWALEDRMDITMAKVPLIIEMDRSSTQENGRRTNIMARALITMSRVI